MNPDSPEELYLLPHGDLGAVSLEDVGVNRVQLRLDAVRLGPEEAVEGESM